MAWGQHSDPASGAEGSVSAGLLTERTRRTFEKACDTASSFTWARIFLGNPRAEVSAQFLREVQADLERAGWPLQRVLTDGGSEFKGVFTATCRELGVRKTKPRHPFTNGFVERVQGTLLHEHWRVEFRRRTFTHKRQIERSLHSALRHYN